MNKAPSLFDFLEEAEYQELKNDSWTDEFRNKRREELVNAQISYIKTLEEIAYKRYEELKPLALELLYSFEKNKLMYYDETNKITSIIKILNKHL